MLEFQIVNCARLNRDHLCDPGLDMPGFVHFGYIVFCQQHPKDICILGSG